MTRRGGMREALHGHLLEISVALSWAVLGLAYLIDGETVLRSPVGAEVGVFKYVWSIFYVIGGPLVVYGCLRRTIAPRVAGLILLSVGLLMHGTAALLLGGDVRTVNYFIFAFACGMRAIVCWRSLVKD